MSVEIVLRLNGADVPVALDDAALVSIATAVADLVPTPGRASTPWLYGARAAAEYLGWPLGRIEKLTAADAIPCHRLRRRITFRRDELDAWLANFDSGTQ